ncbi:hypothetical protein DUNSADRAFT_16821 [Dunaliella salina]|uniref:Kinesin motor domain-containing protein n=1 Tax=Dunaliella salina TaxID=3046 RepID=A0ABQ7G2U7_DUNSA|nr:hypothetical protein DUNSADRAFT_16821 [Dunaliella salina]|eukprot:KAF5828929.1 hypothetical protein DUNSADRAFT_16821 [Dunaliella salina]
MPSPVEEALLAQLGLTKETAHGAAGVISEMALPESLPVGWTAGYDEATRQIIYTDGHTGDQHSKHPLLDYYQGVLFMESQGNALMQALEKATPPGDKEVADMCEYFRIRSDEDPYVREVARMALSAPLPPGWEEAVDETGSLMFRNTSTGVMQPSHPLDVYFNELIARRRTEVDLGRTAAALGDGASPPHTALAATYAPDRAPGLAPSGVTPSSGHGSISEGYSDELEGDAEGGKSSSAALPSTWGDGGTVHQPEKARHAGVVHKSGASSWGDGSAMQEQGGMQQPGGVSTWGDGGAMQQHGGQHTRGHSGISKESRAGSSGMATPPAGAQEAASADADTKEGGVELSREHIRVAVRARPLLNLREKDISAWVIDSKNNTLQLRDQVAVSNKAAMAQGRIFRFNSVEGPDTTNEGLTAQHVQPLLQAAFKGINCTICAYGQTGSGKTHTMFGPSNVRGGVVGMSLAYLFGKVEEAAALAAKPRSHRDGSKEVGMAEDVASSTHYKVTLSMLELYNEQLQDLLASPAQQQQQTLTLVDDPQQGIRVHGLTEVECPSYARALSVIEAGCAARSVGATHLNERSSRAHTIVRVQLEGGGPPTPSNGEIKQHQHQQQGDQELRSIALLHFVDLAGSERLARTGTSGIRVGPRLPVYTHLHMVCTLLPPCLGGNARTAILATINPSHQHVEETLNTLQFAQRTMNVVNTVVQNRLGPAPKGSSKEQARLNALESSKTVLLDRLEGLTGQPQGGVWDLKPPPTPPDLHLPAPRPPGRAHNANAHSQQQLQAVTAETALRSIARVAQTGRPSGASGALRLAALAAAKGGGGPEGVEPPEAVVMAVRRMRAERDELRRRDAKLRKQLNDARTTLKGLEPYLHQQSTIEDCVGMLDDLIGPAPNQDLQPSAGKGKGGDQAAMQMDIMDRLREGVESVVLLSAELSSVQRQLHSSIALQQAAEQRASELEALWHNSTLRTGSSSIFGQDGASAGQVGELRQMMQDMDKYAKALQQELAVTKAELAKWRGFTDEPPMVVGSVQGEGEDPQAPSIEWAPGHIPVDRHSRATAGAAAGASRDGAEAGSGGSKPGGAVVVGSMAIRAAREARARVRACERELHQVQQHRAQLQDRVAELEAAAAAAAAAAERLGSPSKGGGGAGGKGGAAGQGGANLEGGEGNDGATQSSNAAQEETAAQQKEQFERAKARVVSLAREVAALTRERDSLLGIVLEAANQARAQGANGGSDNVPLLMPTSLAQRLLAGGELAGPMDVYRSSSHPPSVSRSSIGSSAGLAGAAAVYRPHPPRSRHRNGDVRDGLGLQSAAAAAAAAAAVAACHTKWPSNLRQLFEAGLGVERPSFDASPPPLETRIKMQKVEDRAVLKGELPPIAGDPGIGKEVLAVNAGAAGGADLVALKRQLVQTEKARRQGELKAAAQVKEAEQQIATLKKQAAAASNAAAEQMARAEEAHAAELGRIKSEATGAITTLMQENARLRHMLAQDQMLNSKLVQSAAGGSLRS